MGPIIKFGSTTLVAAFLSFTTCSASAGEWVVGLGPDDFMDSDGDNAIAALIELHSDPFVQRRAYDLSWMGSLMVDTTHDIFAGVGVHAVLHFGAERFFFEGSFAVGAYSQGGDSPPRKETDTFQYRTSVGAGTRLSENSRISLTVDHLFNSEFRNYEPGSETVLLRYSRQF